MVSISEFQVLLGVRL